MRAHVEILPKLQKNVQNQVSKQSVQNFIARSCGFTGYEHVFSIIVQGGHAGRSRVHVDIIRCTNPEKNLQVKRDNSHVGIGSKLVLFS